MTKSKLERLVANPPKGAIPVFITPTVATWLMERNQRNRQITQATVMKYSRQMTAGDWHDTADPIRISKGGRLIDGQHRCLACIHSQVPFPAMLAFGRPEDEQEWIDLGKKRTDGNFFALRGIKNATNVAAITKMINRLNGNGFTDSPKSVWDLYSEYGPDAIQSSVRMGMRFTRIAKCASIGAAYYLCAQVDPKAAERFFDRVAKGEGFNRGEAAKKFRERLMMDGRQMGKYDVAAEAILAFNSYRRGRGEAPKWSEGQTFPEAR